MTSRKGEPLDAMWALSLPPGRRERRALVRAAAKRKGVPVPTLTHEIRRALRERALAEKAE